MFVIAGDVDEGLAERDALIDIQVILAPGHVSLDLVSFFFWEVVEVPANALSLSLLEKHGVAGKRYQYDVLLNFLGFFIADRLEISSEAHGLEIFANCLHLFDGQRGLEDEGEVMSQINLLVEWYKACVSLFEFVTNLTLHYKIWL